LLSQVQQRPADARAPAAAELLRQRQRVCMQQGADAAAYPGAQADGPAAGQAQPWPPQQRSEAAQGLRRCCLPRRCPLALLQHLRMAEDEAFKRWNTMHLCTTSPDARMLLLAYLRCGVIDKALQ
jgi:hypothetical protein